MARKSRADVGEGDTGPAATPEETAAEVAEEVAIDVARTQAVIARCNVSPVDLAESIGLIRELAWQVFALSAAVHDLRATVRQQSEQLTAQASAGEDRVVSQ